VRRLCRVAIKEGIVDARWESGTRIDGAARRDAGWRVGEADDAANSIEMHKNRSFQLKITVVEWMAG